LSRIVALAGALLINLTFLFRGMLWPTFTLPPSPRDETMDVLEVRFIDKSLLQAQSLREIPPSAFVETNRVTNATGSGSTPTSSSPIPTCCTTPCYPSTNAGRRSCVTSTTSSWRRACWSIRSSTFRRSWCFSRRRSCSRSAGSRSSRRTTSRHASKRCAITGGWLTPSVSRSRFTRKSRASIESQMAPLPSPPGLEAGRA